MSEDLDEIWALYADDGAQSLDTVEAALRKLKGDSQDREAVAELFRAMHTFKGNSRVLGLLAIESCAHVAEDLVGLVRDEGVEIDAELLELLLEATDRLREMMEITVVTRRDAAQSAGETVTTKMQDKLARLMQGLKVGDYSALPPQSVGAPEYPRAETESETYETAVLFEPLTACLANDPLYFQIFLEIARDAIRAMSDALKAPDLEAERRASAICEAADLLCNAAARVGLGEWLALAEQCKENAADTARVAALVEEAERLYRRAEAPAQAHEAVAGGDSYDPRTFLKEISPHLDGLCSFLSAGGEAKAEIVAFCAPIQKAAERLGYIRIADAVAELPVALADPARFEALFSGLHEDLSLIANSEIGPDPVPDAVRLASEFLKSWYQKHLLATLGDLGGALGGRPEDIDWSRVVGLQERFYRACNCFGLETPGRVAVVLLDLSARVVTGEIPPDPLLLRVMKSFSKAAKAFFSEKALGASDEEAMRRLLDETEEVTEALSGAASVRSIEHLLNLPANFRGVLSPESGKAIADSLAAGDRFYVLRADIDARPELADRFLAWANASGKMIGCVTVPAEQPIFDFLLASQIEPEGMKAELLELDPTAEALCVREVVSHASLQPVSGGGGEATETGRFDAGARASASSAEMLESIEEIVTGHGAVREILAAFDKKQILGIVDNAMAVEGGNWVKAREAVSRHLQDWQDGVDRLIQIESQMDKRLHKLQEDAVSARTRPASALIQYLVDYAAGAAQRHARALRFSLMNQSDHIDIDLLEQLSEPLRAFISISIAHSIEPPAVRLGKGKAAEAEMRLGIVRYLDRVVATVEDDGSGIGSHSALDSSALEAVKEAVRVKGGNVDVGASAAGGLRFDVALPLSMAVLAGMIVRAGAIMYVVPIRAIQRIVHADRRDLVYLSAGGRQIHVKLAPDRLAPIRFLSESSEARAHILAPGDKEEDAKCLFVIAECNSSAIALSIDEVVGEQLVIIRPMKGYLSSIRNVMGCALLSNGEIGMVLDLARIV